MGNVKKVAQYIVNYYVGASSPVSNLQLQKLLYFGWIDYYKKKSAYLFDDVFVAWPLGPVVLDAYYEFCAYGAEPILRVRETAVPNINTGVLDVCLARYQGRTGYSLVRESHRKGGAWDFVYQGGPGRDHVIDFELIKAKEC